MQSDLVELRGKTALVTGGAKRLGWACAKALAGEGVNVVLHYNHSAGPAEDGAERLRGMGVAAHVLQAGLSDPAAASELLPRAHDLAGPVHILINSASMFPSQDFAHFAVEEVEANMRVNALAPALISREFAKAPEAESIVNFLDTMVRDYDRTHLPYHLSKRTFHTLTRIMALELAPQVRVNAVAPGLVLPPEGEDVAYLEARKESNPLQRIGSPDGICAAVLFLLRSGFVTGQTIYVDGGRNLRGSMYD